MTTDRPPQPAPERQRAAGRGPALVLAAVLVAFTASRLAIVGVPSEREYDEGVYLISARALNAGHELFTSVFSSQPPAFLETLALALRTFGDRIETGRSMILAFALLSLLACADLARRLAGPWAAPAAAAALALTTSFGDLAHVVSAETSAVALALASMCACLESRRRGWQRRWLLAAGAMLALAALHKLIVVPLAAPFGLLLLLAPSDSEEASWRLEEPGRRIRGVTLRSLVVAAGALLVLAFSMIGYDAGAMLAQTVGFHLSKHEAFELDAAENLQRAIRHFRVDAPIAVSALVGFVLLVLRRRAPAAAWLFAWLLLMLAVLALQTPVFWRHFVLLAPPLAIAAGAGAALAGRYAGRRRSVAVLAIAAAWAALLLPSNRGLFPLLSDGSRDRSRIGLEDAVGWIQRNTRPDELVGGDDPMAIYLAGRQTPPGLCDTSSSRIISESLQVEEAARASLDARVILVRTKGRLSTMPGYFDWLKRNYDARPNAQTGLVGRTAWIRRPDANADATNPVPRRERVRKPPTVAARETPASP